MDTYHSIFALLQECGGWLEGRVRLQKIAYFHHVFGDSVFQDVGFRYRRSGPYSRELSGALQQAISFGDVVEESIGENRYRYVLDGLGLEVVEELRKDVYVPGVVLEADEETLKEAASAVFYVENDKAANLNEALQELGDDEEVVALLETITPLDLRDEIHTISNGNPAH